MVGLVEHSEDRRLLDEARAGSASSFAAFYNRYVELVLAYVARRTPSAEAAADLTMEVFAAALHSTKRGQGPLPDAPAGWLFGIARNVLADSYRRGCVEATARLELSMQSVALEDEDLERVNRLTDEHAVGRLVAALPEEQREAVWSFVVEDRPHSELAKELGCSEMVVRQRSSRGLKALRGALHAGLR